MIDGIVFTEMSKACDIVKHFILFLLLFHNYALHFKALSHQIPKLYGEVCLQNDKKMIKVNLEGIILQCNADKQLFINIFYY